MSGFWIRDTSSGEISEVPQCPGAASELTRECVDVSTCTFIIETKDSSLRCVLTCPESERFLRPWSRSAGVWLCVSSCSGDYGYVNGLECVARCPANRYRLESENKVCVASVDACLRRVEHGLVVECVESCPSAKNFIDSGVCVSECPVYYIPSTGACGVSWDECEFIGQDGKGRYTCLGECSAMVYDDEVM